MGVLWGAEGIYKRAPPPLTVEVAARVSVHHLWCIERRVVDNDNSIRRYTSKLGKISRLNNKDFRP